MTTLETDAGLNARELLDFEMRQAGLGRFSPIGELPVAGLGIGLADVSAPRSAAKGEAGRIKSRLLRVSAAVTIALGIGAAAENSNTEKAFASCTWVLTDPLGNTWTCVEDPPTETTTPPPPPPSTDPAPPPPSTNSKPPTTTAPSSGGGGGKTTTTVAAPVNTEAPNPDPDADTYLAGDPDPNLIDFLENSPGNTFNGAPIDGVQVAKDLGINVDPSTPDGARNAQIARSVAQEDWPTVIANFGNYGIAVMYPTTTTELAATTTEVATTTTSTTPATTTTATSTPRNTTTTIMVTASPPTTGAPREIGSGNTDDKDPDSKALLLDFGVGLLAVGVAVDHIAGRKTFGKWRNSYVLGTFSDWRYDLRDRRRRGPGIGSKPGTPPLTGGAALGRHKTDYAPRTHNSPTKHKR